MMTLMFSIVFIGIVIIVALFAAVAKKYAGKPKKAEKWERAEIMKQLLAQSEGENRSSAGAAPGSKSVGPKSPSAAYSDNSRKGTSRGRNSKRRNRKGNAQPASTAKPNQADGQIEEKIRQRAYELYQARGGANGNSTEDWLQAKQDVLGRKATAANKS